MHWLVKFLFLSWFEAIEFVTPNKIVVGAPTEVALYAILIALSITGIYLIVVHYLVVGSLLPEQQWPKFLQNSIRLISHMMIIGVAGYDLNLIAVVANGMKMPVAPQTEAEIQLYSTLEFDAHHVLAGAETNLCPLVSYISVESSRITSFLFPPDWFGYIAPGDLMIAACIVFSWWIALVIIGWAIYYAVRRVFHI